ncbi:hypothetical protein RRG08_048871 [Elysia crispata]|uniref:Uncharacterized protein n=1 Tax=Elysia crispata TaxID=231223 RepID=A0AAE1CPN1_9GAST|nr:hypothetical protein RRG08_048871 [Elysia crispata]
MRLLKKISRTKAWGSGRRDQEQKDEARGKGIKNKRMGLLEKGSRIKGNQEQKGGALGEGIKNKRVGLLEKGLRTKGWGSWRRDQDQKGGSLGKGSKNKRMRLFEKSRRWRCAPNKTSSKDAKNTGRE